MSANLGGRNTANQHVIKWVEEAARLCGPESVFWCDGSEAEKEFLQTRAVEDGTLIKLNPQKRPGCFYHRSNPNDVARVEQCTYICTPTEDEAGPTNHWEPPKSMYDRLHDLLRGG